MSNLNQPNFLGKNQIDSQLLVVSLYFEVSILIIS
jgi:hypothetical protein